MEQPPTEAPTKPGPPTPPEDWRNGLEPRMRKHVAFCQDYATKHNHGAPGHLDYLTVDTLTGIIDALWDRIARMEATVAALNTIVPRDKGGV